MCTVIPGEEHLLPDFLWSLKNVKPEIEMLSLCCLYYLFFIPTRSNETSIKLKLRSITITTIVVKLINFAIKNRNLENFTKKSAEKFGPLFLTLSSDLSFQDWYCRSCQSILDFQVRKERRRQLLH